jgi:hypothetical protein
MKSKKRKNGEVSIKDLTLEALADALTMYLAPIREDIQLLKKRSVTRKELERDYRCEETDLTPIENRIAKLEKKIKKLKDKQ